MIKYFYCNFAFACIDLSLIFLYLFSNPYRVCRKFYERLKGKKIYIYGETPLTTLYKITQNCGIRPQDNVLELGSGRGRTSFFLSQIIGAKVVGIELVSSFIKKTQFLKKLYRLSNPSFLCSDYYNFDFSQVNVIYLYGVHLEDEKILKLTEKLEKLPSGAKVITISYSMSTYAPKHFKQIKKFPVSFPWGNTFAYLSIKE